MTISAWVKQSVDAPLHPKDIIFKGRPRERWGSLTLRGERLDGSILFQLDDTGSSISRGGVSSFIDGTWHHIAVIVEYENRNNVHDDGSIEEIRRWKITPYIDGKPDKLWGDIDINDKTASSGRMGSFNSDFPLVFGKCYFAGEPANGPCYNYDGYLDELYIFNRLLDESEISALYRDSGNNQFINISKDKIMGYWPFDESSGKILHDLSGNENHCEMKGNM